MRLEECSECVSSLPCYYFVAPSLSPTLPLLPAIFRVVSAVLHFGNLQFKQERNSDQALLPDNTVAQKICKLTGMSVSDFTKALLKPKIKTGREFTVRSQNKAQVQFQSIWFSNLVPVHVMNKLM